MNIGDIGNTVFVRAWLGPKGKRGANLPEDLTKQWLIEAGYATRNQVVRVVQPGMRSMILAEDYTMRIVPDSQILVTDKKVSS